LTPKPHSETTWVVGFATLLLERRNKENPGTCRSSDLRVRPAFALMSSGESSMALPGISESFNSVRVAETTTRSPWAVPRKIKASGVGAEPATQVFSAGAKLLAFTRTVPDPPLG